MQQLLKNVRLAAAILAVTIAGALPSSGALAQTAPPAATAVALPEATIRALQDALNKQGIAVKADGVLNDETRTAIRKYQSVHHLPVTGEPDKATLDKLGVRLSAAQPSTPGQAPSQTTPPAGQMAQGGMMMNCPMMQGQMNAMMPMMKGMMQMMQMMQGQAQEMSTQPGQMAQGGAMMNNPMMQGQINAMMQMMQGMMQMMQMMQGQMQMPGQMKPSAQ